MLVFGLLLLFGLFDYDALDDALPIMKRGSGTSIMCYECNSATNSYCGAAVLPSNLRRNCSEHDRGVTHTLCRKIIQQVDYGINGKLPESRIIRSCGWDESKYKGKCYTRAGYGGRQEVCSCTSDFCNGSHHLTSRGIVAATAFMYTASRLCL